MGGNYGVGDMYAIVLEDNNLYTFTYFGDNSGSKHLIGDDSIEGFKKLIQWVDDRQKQYSNPIYKFQRFI